MKKIKMKPKLKIDRIGHKYALDISKFHEKTNVKIDFNNLNKDFYDDIESNDIAIKKDKKLLSKIKNLSIKEFIFANKEIPYSWKNKLNYQKDMINIISKDENLISYIGSNPKEFTYIKKLPKINELLNKMKKNNIDINQDNDEKTNESRGKYGRNQLKFKSKTKLINDDIKILLDDYKHAYPIKEKLNELMLYSQENYKNFEKELISDNNKNASLDLNINLETFPYIKTRKINSLNKSKANNKRVFKHNIFSFDSVKYNTINKNRSSLFDNNNEKYIKSINYYGPHSSFCPSCRKKNVAFYNNMGHKECKELINHIKNFRKKNNINNYNTLKKSTSDFPKLNLFSVKDNESSESEDNNSKSNKIKF